MKREKSESHRMAKQLKSHQQTFQSTCTRHRWVIFRKDFEVPRVQFPEVKWTQQRSPLRDFAVGMEGGKSRKAPAQCPARGSSGSSRHLQGGPGHPILPSPHPTPTCPHHVHVPVLVTSHYSDEAPAETFPGSFVSTGAFQANKSLAASFS